MRSIISIKSFNKSYNSHEKRFNNDSTIDKLCFRNPFLDYQTKKKETLQDSLQ